MDEFGSGSALTDLFDRASHPCGVLNGEPFSVFALLSIAADAGEQFTAKLNALNLCEPGRRYPNADGHGRRRFEAGSLPLFHAFIATGSWPQPRPPPANPPTYLRRW